MSQQEEEIEMGLLLSGIDFDDEYEIAATQEFGEGLGQGIGEQRKSTTDIEKKKVASRAPEKRKASSESKGKQKVSADFVEPEFDDSSDSDYMQPPEYSEDDDESVYNSEDIDDEFVADIDSDTPSIILEDLETSSDDELFIQKKHTKTDLTRKLRKIIARSHREAPSDERARNPEDKEAENWYSDPGEEDEVEALDSDSESLPFFKEGSNMKMFEPMIGMKFQDFKVYREVLRDYCVRKGYDLHFIRNEHTRITAKCKVETCKWRIHASPIQGRNIFQIKTISGVHTCAKSTVNSLANARYLAKRMEKRIRDNPSIPIADLKSVITRKCEIDATHWMVVRAKRFAMETILGVDNSQYEVLWDYCETVRAKNPGSKILLRRLEGVEPPRFDRMYYSLHAMKMGFLSGCRPIIGLDGCFLKTTYCGQLLVAVARDGNDNMLPIAIALVQVENTDTWSWFLTELLEDIGHVPGLVFMSDRQKGLLEAVKSKAPNSEHRFCLRHMYQNFKVKFKDEKLKELFWRAACSGNKQDFHMYMKKIETHDPKVTDEVQTAVEWLREVPPEHWCRAFFRTVCKSDILVNNLCESFNNYILDARDKPIISMFETIRVKLMTRIQEKKDGMQKYPGTICPNILNKKINVQQSFSRNCLLKLCGGNEFEVYQFLDRYIVDLDKRICTCGMFQLCGYPCCHAHACIAFKRAPVEDYVDDCYKKDTYLKVYEHMIHGVPGRRDYIKTTLQPLLPPKLKVRRGRPAKLRRKGVDELQRSSTRKGLTHKCKNCLVLGHNRRTCPNSTHPSSKYYKGTTQIDPEEVDHNTVGGTAAPIDVEVLSQNTGAPPVDSSQPVAPAQTNKKRKVGGPVVPSAAPVGPPAANTQVQRKTKTTIGGKGTYVGRRNEALLGKQVPTSRQSVGAAPSIDNVATTGNSNEVANAQGSNQSAPSRDKKASVSEVLQNIKKRAAMRKEDLRLKFFLK